MGHNSGQYACSVLPSCICCWRRRTTCRLSEGGQVFLSHPSFLFVPIETLGAIAPCSLDFLTEVGRRLSAATGDARETAFLLQRISVALHRFNALLIHVSFVASDVEPDLYSHSNMCFSCCFKPFGILHHWAFLKFILINNSKSIGLIIIMLFTQDLQRHSSSLV